MTNSKQDDSGQNAVYNLVGEETSIGDFSDTIVGTSNNGNVEHDGETGAEIKTEAEDFSGITEIESHEVVNVDGEISDTKTEIEMITDSDSKMTAKAEAGRISSDIEEESNAEEAETKKVEEIKDNEKESGSIDDPQEEPEKNSEKEIEKETQKETQKETEKETGEEFEKEFERESVEESDDTGEDIKPPELSLFEKYAADGSIDYQYFINEVSDDVKQELYMSAPSKRDYLKWVADMRIKYEEDLKKRTTPAEKGVALP